MTDEELVARLRENEALMKEMELSWEEKLKVRAKPLPACVRMHSSATKMTRISSHLFVLARTFFADPSAARGANNAREAKGA